MARVTIDAVAESEERKSVALNLEDDGCMAQVRFMLGAGESFEAETVHKDTCIKGEATKPRYIACRRQDNEPIESCPLCQVSATTDKMKREIRWYLPVYVISTTNVIGGISQQPVAVNAPMLFQRPKSFINSLKSVIRQCNGTPIVSNVFNIVRNGKKKDTQTTYTIEFVTRDNTTLEDLPPRINPSEVKYLLELNYEEMAELKRAFDSNGGGVQPRGAISQPQSAVAQPQWNQVSSVAPNIPY